MSFWMDQNLEYLEERLNYIGDKIQLDHAPTLKHRFFTLREEKHSLFSEQQLDKTCECTGGKETFTVLRPDCDGYLCLAPVVALIQGNDRIQNWIIHDMKKSLFQPFKHTRQPKVTEYFRPSTAADNTQDNDETDRAEKLPDYPECSLKCILNEWKDGVCFIRFVRHYKVNLRIHKSQYGGCRWILGEENKELPTVHLHYASGYSLILPPIADFHRLPQISTKKLVSEEQMEYYRTTPPISEEKMNFYKSEPPPFIAFSTQSQELPIRDTAFFYDGASSQLSQEAVQNTQPPPPTQTPPRPFHKKFVTQPTTNETLPPPLSKRTNKFKFVSPPPVIAFSKPTQEMPIRNTAFFYEGVSPPVSQEAIKNTQPTPTETLPPPLSKKTRKFKFGSPTPTSTNGDNIVK